MLIPSLYIPVTCNNSHLEENPKKESGTEPETSKSIGSDVISEPRG